MADVRERYWLACLMDLYGPLLTEHRREIMSMYCDEDLSFGEIAEQLSITRQGVSDAVNKAKTQLEDYERKLGLAQQDAGMRESIRKCLTALDEDRVSDARSELESILKER